VFSRAGREPGRPNRFPTFFRERKTWELKKGAAMKFATVTKSTFLGLALLLASSAFAGNTNKADLHLNNPTTVNGTKLKPGDYKLEWEGTGASVDVSIKQGKTVLAKVQGKVVDLQSPAANSAAVLQKHDDGSTALAGARFEGKKFALELGESSDSMQPGSSK
jgi:hypothetical protein